jgi:uncharacterized protein with PQ loop repeat
MTLFEILAWIGNICFVLSGLPQAYRSIKEKHSNGISGWMLILWFLGNGLSLIYVLSLPTISVSLILGYVCSLINIGVISYYKVIGRSIQI